jgi:hypothetical protein
VRELGRGRGRGQKVLRAMLIFRLETNKGRIAVKGTAGSNSTHSINEDERRSFTDHINGVSNALMSSSPVN